MKTVSFRRASRLLAAGAVLATLTSDCAAQRPRGGADSDLPPEFRQIIPRGRIASIDDPDFVSAGEAEISGDAWVLGVEIGGAARAYSLNLLNSHEVVNHHVGGKAISAVW